MHHDLSPMGGATAVIAWIIQALKDDFALTMLTSRPIDLEALNRFHGTSISDSDLEIVCPNRLVRTILNLDWDYHSIQPVAYLMRVCRKIRENYDLVIGSGTEEMDLGGSGILYVHFPHLARFWGKYRDCGHLPMRSQLGGLLRGETRPWMILAGYSIERMKQATILVNSDWTGEAVRSFYKVPTTTLYPPVTASARCREWEERENGFLCIGRMTPPKRMDIAMSILRRVREHQPDLKLHLVGPRSGHPDHRQYDRSLRDLVRGNRDWVRLHEDLPRDRLLELMGQMRYGIHANRDEHFGIAPAELMASGCIVFVHKSGGQVEIVGRDQRLCYLTDEEAADKIASVLKSPTMQASILNSLAPRRTMFSASEFMRGLRGVVERMTASGNAYLSTGTTVH